MISSFARRSRHFICQTAVIFLALGSFHAAAASSEVWISALPTANGTGTSAKPYDGSTQVKFDALMVSFQDTPNLTIHLGPGTFRSNVALASWSVRSNWIINGAGMYSTTCQMMGNLAGKHWDMEFFKSLYSFSTDHVAIRDLTVDCNWSELSLTADMGAGGERFGAVYAINICGSYNLIERVRCINSRGSFTNANESFGIGLSVPATGDATGNIIRYCRVESPQGSYGAPLALGGSNGTTTHYMTNSSVYGNYVVGQNTGLQTGFTTGGVNGAFIKNCQIHDNVFIDCAGIYYQDTGTVDGLQILNNKIVRGWLGIGLVANADPTWTKSNVNIAGNSINIQNRSTDYGSVGYGIHFAGTTSLNCSITGNYISFTPTGLGYKQFQTITGGPFANAIVFNNTADEASAGTGLGGPLLGGASGSNIQISGNRTTTGLPMAGLSDNVALSQAAGKTLNFSTRATVGTGENTLIDGFIITGTAPKKVIVRALGPSLTQFGVQNALTNPTLTLYDHTGAVLASNDNWKDTQQAEITATRLQPSNDLESAIVQTLPPGLYTTAMNGKNGATGVGLLEVYDLDKTANSTLGNVSTRGLVGTGDNVVIGGFIVGSGASPLVLAMGIGPSLASAGINNPLADPVLELHDVNGGLIAENNDWKDTQQDLITATGFTPSDDHEAAILAWLTPGNYTTILRGNNATTGVGLVQIYRMN